MRNLSYYLKCFTSLRRDYSFGGAPHKPILLLAVIENIEQGLIKDEKIFITPDLVASFKSNWSTFVVSKHTMKFAMPYTYMSGEPFWNLIPKQGYEFIVKARSSLESFTNLNAAIAYALLDKELFLLLYEKQNRDLFRFTLLDKYFPDRKTDHAEKQNYISQVSQEILEDTSEEYRKTVEIIQNNLSQEEYCEELFVRGSIFKREIPKIYRNTCCITGLSISATFSISMIDACHIIPFSESHDDTISNGLALSPNMHRAFDRGLITIDENYKVVVSGKFNEDSSSPYSIKQFNNHTILLPLNNKYYPELKNLGWHKENVFNQ
jgi:putative restriction endonuclease